MLRLTKLHAGKTLTVASTDTETPNLSVVLTIGPFRTWDIDATYVHLTRREIERLHRRLGKWLADTRRSASHNEGTA